jgi:tripartite-type tricarboxylate transporter receptor subunit TctC
MVVPQAPGGATDVLGRLIAAKLATIYTQPIVVENRLGASGHIGAAFVAKATPDGLTLLLGTIGIHAAYSSYRKLSYNPATDLQPVMVVGESPNVVLVSKASPFKTFGELLAYQKAHPGKLNYATAGAGSSVHMVTALFERMIDSKVIYVPYKGSAPAEVDLIGGRDDVMFENLPTAMPPIHGGLVRALAVTSSKRDPLLPDVPTIAEAGIPGYNATSWFSVAVSSKVPKSIVETLSGDLRKVLSTPETAAQFSRMGITLVADTPEQARKFFASETAKWSALIQASGIYLD